MNARGGARRHWCRNAAALALAAPWLGVAQAADDKGAGLWIDTAGRQRMLSQRIVKAYCQIGLEVNPEASRVQLNEAVLLFDSQLTQLRRAAPNAAVRKALSKVGSLWFVVRRMALGKVGKDNVRGLALRSEDLLRACQDVVLALEANSGTRQSRLVDIAGRQRMLSQRMAKAYMMRAWGIEAAGIGAELDQAASEFAGALAMLRAEPGNTPEMARELESVAGHWEWFSGAIKLQGEQSYALVVAEASEAILRGMETVTGLYAAAAR